MKTVALFESGLKMSSVDNVDVDGVEMNGCVNSKQPLYSNLI